KRKTDTGRAKSVMAGVEAALALRRKIGGMTVSGIGAVMGATSMEKFAEQGLMNAGGLGNVGQSAISKAQGEMDPMEMLHKHSGGRMLSNTHNLLSMYKNRLLRGEENIERRIGLLDDPDQAAKRERLEIQIKRRKRGEDPYAQERKEERKKKRAEKQKAREDRREKRRQEKEMLGQSDNSDSSSSSTDSDSDSLSDSKSSSRSSSRSSRSGVRQRAGDSSDDEAPWDPIERMRRMQAADEIRRKQEEDKERKHKEELAKLQAELEKEAARLGITVPELKIKQAQEAEKERQRKAEEMQRQAEEEEEKRRQICEEKGWTMEELLEREILAAEHKMTLEELEEEMKKASFWKKEKKKGNKKPSFMRAEGEGSEDSEAESAAGAKGGKNKRADSRGRGTTADGAKNKTADGKPRSQYRPGAEKEDDNNVATTLDPEEAEKMRQRAGVPETPAEPAVHFPGWQTVEEGTERGASHSFPTVAGILGKNTIDADGNKVEEPLGGVMDSMKAEEAAREKEGMYQDEKGEWHRDKNWWRNKNSRRPAKPDEMPLPSEALNKEKKQAPAWFGEDRGSAEAFLHAAANKAREEFLKRALKSIKTGSSVNDLDFSDLMRDLVGALGGQVPGAAKDGEEGMSEEAAAKGAAAALGGAGGPQGKGKIEFNLSGKARDYQYFPETRDNAGSSEPGQPGSTFAHLMEQARLAREAQEVLREKQEALMHRLNNKQSQQVQPGETEEEAFLRRQIEQHIATQGGIAPPVMGEAQPLAPQMDPHTAAMLQQNPGYIPFATMTTLPSPGDDATSPDHVGRTPAQKEDPNSLMLSDINLASLDTVSLMKLQSILAGNTEEFGDLDLAALFGRKKKKGAEKKKKKKQALADAAARAVMELDTVDAEGGQGINMDELDEETRKLMESDLVITSSGQGWRLKGIKGEVEEAGGQNVDIIPPENADENVEMAEASGLDDMAAAAAGEETRAEKKKKKKKERKEAALATVQEDPAEDAAEDDQPRADLPPQSPSEDGMGGNAEFTLDDIADDAMDKKQLKKEKKKKDKSLQERIQALDAERKARHEKKEQQEEEDNLPRPTTADPVTGYKQDKPATVTQLYAESKGVVHRRGDKKDKKDKDKAGDDKSSVSLGPISIVAYEQRGPRDMVYVNEEGEGDDDVSPTQHKVGLKSRADASSSSKKDVAKPKDEMAAMVSTKLEQMASKTKSAGEAIMGLFRSKKKEPEQPAKADNTSTSTSSKRKADEAEESNKSKKSKKKSKKDSESESSSSDSEEANQSTSTSKRARSPEDKKAVPADVTMKTAMPPPALPLKKKKVQSTFTASKDEPTPASLKSAKFDSTGSINRAPVINPNPTPRAPGEELTEEEKRIREKQNVFYDEKGNPVYFGQVTGITSMLDQGANIGSVIMAEDYAAATEEGQVTDVLQENMSQVASDMLQPTHDYAPSDDIANSWASALPEERQLRIARDQAPKPKPTLAPGQKVANLKPAQVLYDPVGYQLAEEAKTLEQQEEEALAEMMRQQQMQAHEAMMLEQAALDQQNAAAAAAEEEEEEEDEEALAADLPADIPQELRSMMIAARKKAKADAKPKAKAKATKQEKEEGSSSSSAGEDINEVKAAKLGIDTTKKNTDADVKKPAYGFSVLPSVERESSSEESSSESDSDSADSGDEK
ncbi:unnamed protein product, partial [Amoebophrya sp. A25]